MPGVQGSLLCPILEGGDANLCKIVDVGGDDRHTRGVGNGGDAAVLGADAFDVGGEGLKNLLGFVGVRQSLVTVQQIKEIFHVFIGFAKRFAGLMALNPSQGSLHHFLDRDDGDKQMVNRFRQDLLAQLGLRSPFISKVTNDVGVKNVHRGYSSGYCKAASALSFSRLRRISSRIPSQFSPSKDPAKRARGWSEFGIPFSEISDWLVGCCDLGSIYFRSC